MRKILIIIFCIFSNRLLAQTIHISDTLDSFKIEQNTWVANGLLLDTMYNPGFKPNPVFIHANQSDSTEKLNIKIDKFNFDAKSNNLLIKGRISGSEFQGWGSEAFIIVGTRLDSVIANGYFHGDFHPIDTIKCLYVKNIDFSYTNCNFGKPKSFVDFNCTLNVKNHNNILIIAKNDYFVEIFDLEKIKKYSH
jgi:hypothetical protein